MNCKLDHIQIGCGGSLCISDYLITLWEKISKTRWLTVDILKKMAAKKPFGRDIL